MTAFARNIPKLTTPRLTIFVLALAGLAAPASATITYTSCNGGGCSSTTGTYAIWQTASGSAGLTFSMSPAAFAPGGNLASGVYTDPTGTVFTGYSGASTIDTAMSVSGSSLLQSVSSNGTGIEIQLPANTYAFAMDVTAIGGFLSPYVGPGTHNSPNTNYNIVIPSGGTVEFFGIISDMPIPTIFIGPLGNGGRLQINDFELGQEAPTPELGSIVLIGTGLVLLGLMRRRVHKPNSPFAGSDLRRIAQRIEGLTAH